jgi:hypothetical protein
LKGVYINRGCTIISIMPQCTMISKDKLDC